MQILGIKKFQNSLKFPLDNVDKDSIIDDIKGISFDTGKIILDAGIKNFNSTFLVEIPNTTVLMSENWEKYIYTLSKTII